MALRICFFDFQIISVKVFDMPVDKIWVDIVEEMFDAFDVDSNMNSSSRKDH